MFTLPDLPYAYNALEPYIDEQTMRLHHDKHHATYIKNLNDALIGHEDLLTMEIDELLRNLSKVPEGLRTKVKNNGGGHSNHAFFWTIMTPSADKEPKGRLAEEITKMFGDFPSFQEKFTQAALGRFGSGWAWLVIDRKNLAIVDTSNQDSPVMDGKIPILGLDLWEHAYYLKYQNRRVEYIQAWWNVINWQEVSKRWEQNSG